jgi:hypothetical protein
METSRAVDPSLSRSARRLRDVVEPIAASVYFAPEVHAAFVGLGFDPSPGAFRGVQGPDRVAYFTSRGAALGTVPGEVVAAAFGVFNPAAVVPAVAQGWSVTDRDSILAARLDGQRAFLQRVVPDGVDVARATALLQRAAEHGSEAGHHLYAGLRSLGYPGDPMGDLWRAADLVREHRGDCHVVAWTAAGLSAPEILLLTEAWWGLPLRSYAATRAWSDAQFDEADEALRSAGYLDGADLTDVGRNLRRSVEAATDGQERRVIAALGDDLDELVALLRPVADAVLEAGGYPRTAFQTESDLDVG